MTSPNTALQAYRRARGWSQEDLARHLRDAGISEAGPRLIQRWESGQTRRPQTAHARALEHVTGQTLDALGFDTRVSPGTMPTVAAQPLGTYTGVWLSAYGYHSSSRDSDETDQRYVLLLQHADRLTVRSLPGTGPGEITMDLTLDGYVATGTWREATAPDGYYRGAVYHGAAQLVADPTGRRLAGKWVGFGRNLDINSGPWDLTFIDASTAARTLEAYGRPVDEETPVTTDT